MFILTKKLLLVISLFILASLVIAGLGSVNWMQKVASANVISSCGANEILDGNNCIFTKISNIQYETKCASQYTLMDAVCVKFATQSCSYFPQALDDGSGLCKLNLATTVYGTEIIDNDGRQCNGTGTNFKRYNVGLPPNSFSGPVICGNNFSLLDKSTFRFLPRTITEIGNLSSIQIGSSFQPCPSIYTEIALNKCSRAAVAQGCKSNGEIFINSKCIPCPAGQYCPVDGVVARSITICANGGTLNSNLCVAPVKYSMITYKDGCTSEYVQKDQSCAVVQTRTHDTGCSYFYTSQNINVTATQGADGYCSTGGRVDFESASISRVSDFNCNGVGTYYYNYNVAYDPLVCGNDYQSVGKAGFRWLPATFTRITALQKIPSNVSTCPVGWSSFDNSNNCSQASVIGQYKDPVDCPINTYCPGSNVVPVPCPAGTSSPVRSVTVLACVAISCNNGTLNPPACNQCLVGLQLVNNLCLPVCPAGVTRDSSGNCTVCANGAANPSSGCTIVISVICKNGFELVNNSCVCVSPKVVVNKLVGSNNLYQAFCEAQVLASSSTAATVTNNGDTINVNPTISPIINIPVNNTPVNNNIVNNYAAPAQVVAPKTQLIPMAAPITVYYTSPVANVTETIRSGGFNVIVILSTIIAAASFGLIYIRGKRNQDFGNFTFRNNIDR